MRVLHVVAETPLSFLQHLKDITYIERRPLRYVFLNSCREITYFLSLRFCAERLQSLVRTLELNRLDEHASLQKVASFATLVATYEKGLDFPNKTSSSDKSQGFLLILEPFETDNATVPNPIFHLTLASL